MLFFSIMAKYPQNWNLLEYDKTLAQFKTNLYKLNEFSIEAFTKARELWQTRKFLWALLAPAHLDLSHINFEKITTQTYGWQSDHMSRALIGSSSNTIGLQNLESKLAYHRAFQSSAQIRPAYYFGLQSQIGLIT